MVVIGDHPSLVCFGDMLTTVKREHRRRRNTFPRMYTRVSAERGVSICTVLHAHIHSPSVTEYAWSRHRTRWTCTGMPA